MRTIEDYEKWLEEVPDWVHDFLSEQDAHTYRCGWDDAILWYTARTRGDDHSAEYFLGYQDGVNDGVKSGQLNHI